MSDTRIPVIFDTDPGLDDAVAIMLAAANDEKLNIIGLTPVDGNVKAVYTFENARKLRELFKIDCDVAKGADTQLEKRCPRSSSVHGATGLGDVALPEPTLPFSELPAWDYIYEKAKEFAGRLEIIAIGPLTNLAHLVQKHPDAKDLIKRVLIMGGSVKEPGPGVRVGNVTPYAEFNFWVDPAAAKVVFESGIPLVMAGLNVTEPTGIALSFIDEITASGSYAARCLKGFISSYGDQLLNKEGVPSSIVHDAVPVTYLLNPQSCTTREAYVTIATDDKHYGQSIADYSRPEQYNCTIITDMDLRYYEGLYKDMVATFEDRIG